MIGALEGKPIQTRSNSTILMVRGVGYQVAITPTTASAISNKETVFLFVHTVAKQDSLELFGFATEKDMVMYKLLLGVSGVGPKIALAIIDYGVSGIANAVANADVTFFTQIPKVGKKMAQKIIIDLKNKVGSVADLDLSEDATDETSDLIQTLVNMGYNPRDARDMVRMIPDEVITIEEKIVYVLKQSGK